MYFINFNLFLLVYGFEARLSACCEAASRQILKFYLTFDLFGSELSYTKWGCWDLISHFRWQLSTVMTNNWVVVESDLLTQKGQTSNWYVLPMLGIVFWKISTLNHQSFGDFLKLLFYISFWPIPSILPRFASEMNCLSALN